MDGYITLGAIIITGSRLMPSKVVSTVGVWINQWQKFYDWTSALCASSPTCNYSNVVEISKYGHWS